MKSDHATLGLAGPLKLLRLARLKLNYVMTGET